MHYEHFDSMRSLWIFFNRTTGSVSWKDKILFLPVFTQISLSCTPILQKDPCKTAKVKTVVEDQIPERGRSRPQMYNEIRSPVTHRTILHFQATSRYTALSFPVHHESKNCDQLKCRSSKTWPCHQDTQLWEDRPSFLKTACILHETCIR